MAKRTYSDEFFTNIAEGALFYRQYGGRLDRWRRYLRYMATNFYDPNAFADEDRAIINLLATRVRSVPPKLAIGIPTFNISPVFTSPEPNSAAFLAACMAWLWEAEGMGTITQAVTLDAALIGRGIGFCGYESYWGDLDQGDFGRVARVNNAMGIVSSFTKFVKSLFGGADGDDADRARLDRYNDDAIEAMKMLVAERTFLARVSPLKFLIDPVAESFQDAAYMGRELYLTPEAGREMFGDKCPRAESIGNVGLADAGVDEVGPVQEDHELQTHLHEDCKRVYAIELWHMPSQQTVYLDKDRKMILRGDWRSAYEGFPFVEMDWDGVPDCVIPEGMGSLIEPLQKELNLIRSRELMESKKAARKYLVDDDINDDELAGLMSDVDGEFVRRPPGEGKVELLQTQFFQPEFWTLEDRIKGDINEASQTSEYDTGGAPDIRRTATESAFIQSTSNAMMGFRQSMVEKFVEGVTQRTISTITTVWDRPVLLTIKNEDPELVRQVDGKMEAVGLGEEVEAPFIGIDHAGVWRSKVEPGTLVAQAKDVERQQLITIAGTFAQDGFVNRESLFRYIMASVPGIKDVDQFIVQQQASPAAPTEGAPVAGAGAGAPSPLAAPTAPPGFGVGAGGPASPMMPPADPMAGMGAINQADLQAATMGGNAPFTG